MDTNENIHDISRRVQTRNEQLVFDSLVFRRDLIVNKIHIELNM
jgi:hypothetical protein